MEQTNFEEIINKYESNSEYPNYYHESNILEMLEEVWNLAIQKCSEKAKCESDGDYLIPEIDKNSILKLKV